MLHPDPLRLPLAALACALYLLLCVLPAWLRVRRQSRAAAQLAAGEGWLIAYASQTGNGHELALRTAETLRAGGVAARVLELDAVDAALLQRTERALFVVATYGEGDPPDNAARFVARTMAGAPDLGRLHYGLLALGDRTYRHFCGFGAALDDWLRACGATPMGERIEADRADPAALRRWRELLGHQIGTADAPDWDAPALSRWVLARRALLNPGSAGAPVWHVRLEPDGAAPAWEAGDLVQLAPPADPGRLRDYSIASIPADGAIELAVRLQRRADGRLGAASSFLARELAVGAALELRVRAHPRFRCGDNAGRPLLLIGNGTGIAGLRAHLRARAAAPGAPPCWLVFGERNAAADALYGAELRGWRERGVLERLDLVWSRDGGAQRYVQDRLRAEGDAVRAWIAGGAAVYVCGSLEGMAGGVDAALRAILGDSLVDDLAAQGRYRRDVY